MKCKCGYHPSINADKFEIIFSEFGILDKVLIQEEIATCKSCLTKFSREWK